MSGESDGLAIFGTIGAIVLGLVTGRWWLWVPASLLLVILILCLLPAHGGGRAYREPDASDEIEARLRAIQRSIDNP